MGYNSSIVTTFLFIATLCILLPEASAFGAGDIPDFAYLNGWSFDVTGYTLWRLMRGLKTDKAFRHGDIESVLEKLAKTASRTSIGGSGIIGIAASVIKAAAGPSKFSKGDIKKVYFVSIDVAIAIVSMSNQFTGKLAARLFASTLAEGTRLRLGLTSLG